MPQMRFIGAWLCLLLWGGVHAVQLQHAVSHHLVESGGHDTCHHHCHHHVDEGVASEPLGVPEDPGVIPMDACPICDWTGVPAMPDLIYSETAAGTQWPPCCTLGELLCGWGSPAIWAGIGWRGPPESDKV